MTRLFRVRTVQVLLGVLAMTAVVFGLTKSTGASSNVWSKAEVEDALASLDAWYEEASQEIARSGSPTDLTALNEEYERRFSEIGGELPNGYSVVPDRKDDDEPNAGAMGLAEVGEQDSTYYWVNKWHGIVDGREIYALATIRLGDGVPGVMIMRIEPGGSSTFIPAPAKGDVSIASYEGDGTLLVSVGEGKLAFDLRSESFL